MKKIIAIAIIMLTVMPLFSESLPDRDTVYQVSTINALLEGVFEGKITVKDLVTHGDTGIGTFNALDGELVMLDRVVYQVRSDGKIYKMPHSATTPFAAVTWFDNDHSIQCPKTASFKELQDVIDAALPTKNIMYALKITGTFSVMKTRSVPRQNKPYPRLPDVTKQQPVFNLTNVKGTIVGFRLPEYTQGINVPGYHMHFISEDAACGGHVLDCVGENLTIQIDPSSSFYMVLPQDEDFYQAEIGTSNQNEIEEVEK
jgi:acetolactate decarboxylase